MKYKYNSYSGDEFPRERHLLMKNIPDDLYAQLKENNVYILGGALTSVFTNNKINDIDLYFPDGRSLINIVAYINQDIINKKRGELIVDTFNAKTYKIEGNIIQLITKENIMGDMGNIMDGFDFTACLAGYNIKYNQFEFPQEFLLHNSQKKLIFTNNTKYPICSMFRLKKYLNRGYKISGIEMIKIALAIHSLEIKNFKDLKEQLEGIDTFMLQDLTKEFLDKKDVEYNYQDFLDQFQIYLQKYYDKIDIVKDMFDSE